MIITSKYIKSYYIKINIRDIVTTVPVVLIHISNFIYIFNLENIFLDGKNVFVLRFLVVNLKNILVLLYK